MSLSKKELETLKRQIEKRRAALQEELHADAEKARGESYADLSGSVADEGLWDAIEAMVRKVRGS